VISNGGLYKNEWGEQENLFSILKRAGINTIRIRLWHNPVEFHPWNGGYLDRETVTEIAALAVANQMDWMLDFHYSDTWADPGNQQKPEAWKNLTFEQLVDELYTYTCETLQHFNALNLTPRYVQLGNEINNGMLWEDGKIYQNGTTNFTPLITLLQSAAKAVRDHAPSSRILLHLASGNDAQQFYQFFLTMLIHGVDFDIIAASFYSYWNGRLSSLKANFEQLAIHFEKDVLLVEFAQAYTLKPNPNGTNIYGPVQEEESFYPATVAGQASMVYDALKLMVEVPSNRGLGVVYWEPAWIPLPTQSNFTSWANQTFFTYDGQVIPSLYTFQAVK
jgi:arabinogalactan endo-1,4-beta-galactosidase